jgi:hypothetical protein
MAETNLFNDAPVRTTTGIERSAEEIQQTIVAKEQDMMETVSELGERIQEKLDWREYVRDYPYATLGVLAGAGFLASLILIPRPATSVQKVMETVGEEVGHGFRRFVKGRRQEVILGSLMGLASTLAMGVAQKTVSKALFGEKARCSASARQEADREITEHQEVANA